MPKRALSIAAVPRPAGAYSQAIASSSSVEPLPARTTIQSDLPGFEIEVDAVLFVDA